ncbi:uncharacterized protein B0H18DRAFT_1115273 [Fomitopsis serialis]|uniref:uncharacterized protein n=1 Tax=Fomitopsis serialis TaxID=139415 RepID=UPI002007A53C|nr:uncharacterized protein B0H18DRAFT_1115273 [Neoantrodia serialis]KAH9933920.1 hypothetical protein B0H18DRAFT_1115273 [Neoantrodia serialis]
MTWTAAPSVHAQEQPTAWMFGSIHTPDATKPMHQLCAPQLSYLKDIVKSWDKLLVPDVWAEHLHDQSLIGTAFEKSSFFETFTTELDFHRVRVMLNQIRDDLMEFKYNPFASPHSASPTFCSSLQRYTISARDNHQQRNQNSLALRTHKTLNQVAQILHYRDTPLLAEHVIASALDGIPGVYIRKQNMGLDGQQIVPDTIQFMALYIPIQPITGLSLERLLRLPASRMNPALLLCAVGPRPWNMQCQRQWNDHENMLLPTRYDMARTAAPSLSSLVDGLRHQSDTGTTVVNIPEWALIIGLIYDSQDVHFVAHIPFFSASAKEPRYLSFLFATLPFPSQCIENARDFVKARYRVAIALLSIQQHVYRIYGDRRFKTLYNWTKVYQSHGDCWLSIASRILNLLDEKYVARPGAYSIGPIPVPRVYLEDDDTGQSLDTLPDIDVFLTKLILRWLQKMQRNWVAGHEDYCWLTTQDRDTLSPYVPRLYVRDDSTLGQKTSALILYHPCTESTQFWRELPPEGLIGHFITRILGGSSSFWTSVSLGRQVDVPNDSLPFFVAVQGKYCDRRDAAAMALAVRTARLDMTCVLHRTLDAFVEHHYKAQDWRTDRELTDADARIALDENLFVLSVFYSNCTFRSFVNYPKPVKNSEGSYRWKSHNVELEAFDFEQPLQLRERAVIFSTMLTIEQHIYNLKGLGLVQNQ